MVKVKSTKGGFVQVEIEGINSVVNRLQSNAKRILSASEFELVRVGNFVQNEVQESIIGNRAETKSVDSGKLGNSIDVKIDKGRNIDTAIIFAKKQRYPNSKTTTEKVANILEFGTRKIQPRRHFRNTKARVEKQVVDKFDNIVKLAIK